MRSTPKIAIIGSGPSGLALACLLHRAKIEVTVFERDKSSTTRSQGGTLNLHTDAGLRLIKEAGLWDAFKRNARWEGEAFVISNKHGKKYLDIKPGPHGAEEGRPVIDRMRLREIMLESLPTDVVRWGSIFLGIQDDNSVRFEHGVEREFDLIVGADGAWSKVRPALSSAQPHYSGVGGVDFTIADAAKRYDGLSKFVGPGSYAAYGDGRCIFAQQNGDGSITVYVWGQRSERWADECDYDLRDLAEVKASALNEYNEWAPELLQLIEVADEILAIRAIYLLPVGHRWDARPGVTMIGDAAHLMTPFAGEGVNVAMVDALELSAAIVSGAKEGGTKDFAKAIRAFEEMMFKRGETIARHTWLNGHDKFFNPDFPDSMIQGYIQRQQVPEESLSKESAGQSVQGY